MPSKMTAPAPAASLPPGFIALHGNRIETLLDTVAGWLAQHPLAPLESEVIDRFLKPLLRTVQCRARASIRRRKHAVVEVAARAFDGPSD